MHQTHFQLQLSVLSGMSWTLDRERAPILQNIESSNQETLRSTRSHDDYVACPCASHHLCFKGWISRNTKTEFSRANWSRWTASVSGDDFSFTCPAERRKPSQISNGFLTSPEQEVLRDKLVGCPDNHSDESRGCEAEGIPCSQATDGPARATTSLLDNILAVAQMAPIHLPVQEGSLEIA